MRADFSSRKNGFSKKFLAASLACALLCNPGFSLPPDGSLFLGEPTLGTVGAAGAPTQSTTVRGGLTNAGLNGDYFSTPDLSGNPTFQRKDVRVDFEWAAGQKPGGSIGAGFRDVQADNFSVRWAGQVIPCFSESYTFKVWSTGGVRLYIRPMGGAWTTLIDNWTIHTGTMDESPFNVSAGTRYEVKLEYRKATGYGAVSLRWQSPSLPEQVIDPFAQVGFNAAGDLTSAFTNIIQGARNTWEPYNGGARPTLDSDGWPQSDCEYIFQESLNQGLGLDPLMRGTIRFSFKGKANVSLSGNLNGASLAYSYNSSNNTTTGSFQTVDKNVNASAIRFVNSHRDGQPTGPGGLTDLKLMRPIAPDSTATYGEDTIFTSHQRNALSHFTTLRYQLVANLEHEWADRTLPTFFNQSSGKMSNGRLTTSDGTPLSWNWDSNNPQAIAQPNGPSWEYKVMAANETGRDIMLSIPTDASNDYTSKLANLLRYGSDGVNPYTSPQTNPVFPPLNSNLRVYFEIANELWNWGNPFWIDWQGINSLVAEHVDAKDSTYQAINYDNQPLTVQVSVEGATPGSTLTLSGKSIDGATINKTGTANGAGTYVFKDLPRGDANSYSISGGGIGKKDRGAYDSINTWRLRFVALRTKDHSDTFRAVYGDDKMMSTVRPLVEWQYTNTGTIIPPFDFMEHYFNNADGTQHVSTPYPINHFFWGGGGATYYGAANGNGLTTILRDPTFNATTVSAGFNASPSNPVWSFKVPTDGTSAAGIFRLSNPINPPAGMPAPYDDDAVVGGKDAPWNAGITWGPQYAYLKDRGEIKASFTIPANQTSNVYAVSFKALNHAGQMENVRVYLDDNTDITSRSYSQGDGYTPPAYDSNVPWRSRIVAWTWSDYYATKTFQATPGSTHTITIRGQGNLGNPSLTGQTVYIGEVRITSADAIFAGGIPGGGEAAGQPAGLNYQNMINTEVSWAKSYGLETLTYEGGWSLGGDDGGSPLQTAVKYNDARAADAQSRSLDMFSRAGGEVTVLGTYAQWPSWADFTANQGLLDISRYPITQGIDQSFDSLPPAPTNGHLIPSALSFGNSTTSSGAGSGGISQPGGWISWNIIVPRTGTYTLTLNTRGAGGSAELSVDGSHLLITKSPLAEIDSLAGTTMLTAGLHTVRIRGLSPNGFQIVSMIASMPDAPASPYLNDITQSGSSFNLSWTNVSGATGYHLRMVVDDKIVVTDCGPNLSRSVSGLSSGKIYMFTVTAYNDKAESLPSNTRSVNCLDPGDDGILVQWDLSGYVTLGIENVSPSVYSPTIAPGLLSRGSGLQPGTDVLGVGRYASTPDRNLYDATLAGAVANARYVEFSVGPQNNVPVSISSLTMRAYAQDGKGYAVVAHSVEGAPFNTTAPDLVFDFAAASPSPNLTATTSLLSAKELQASKSPITFRVYVYGQGPYTTTGPENIVLTGSVGRSPSLITLTSNPNPSQYRAVVTLNAAVTQPATGLVTFKDGSRVLGTSAILNGAATITVQDLTPGAHSLNASYAGDTNYLPSVSPSYPHVVTTQNLAGGTDGHVRAVPNPKGPNDPYVLFENIDIDSAAIYTRTGVKVATLKEPKWDGRNDNGERVANGIYFGDLKSKSGVRERLKIGVVW